MQSTEEDGDGGGVPAEVVISTGKTDALLPSEIVVSSFSSVSRRPPRRTKYSSRTSQAGHVLTAPVDPCLRERIRKLFCFSGGGKSSDDDVVSSSSKLTTGAEASCQNSTSS